MPSSPLSASPLLRIDATVREHPAPHTDAELASLLDLLARHRPQGRSSRVRVVAVGHGRDTASVAAVRAFVQAWEGLGGGVLCVVDWPEQAASWLRQARRLTDPAPDAWVVAGTAPGWAQMSRRLRHSTGWSPEHSFGFASVPTPEAVRLAGPGTLEGMRGADADGGTWRIGRHLITYRSRLERP